MSQVKYETVLDKDDQIRLDRWFQRYYPELKNGQLQRLLRGKNIRVNNQKSTADYRLKAGDVLRIPPMEVSRKIDLPRDLSKADIDFMRSLVIYKDDDVLVLNKPAGIAVQGGTKTDRHIDGMLDALRFDKEERPRLVHRLDKETSGALVLARTAKVATKLADSFSSRLARKIYWAVVVGKPKLLSGKIDAPLSKLSSVKGGEQMRVDFNCGQKAQTLYRVLDSLGHKASWLELSPLTGRTHQLRVHCQTMNTPIVGDVKYGGDRSVSLGLANERKMHLHARAIRIPHPTKGFLEVTAPLPRHMKETFEFLNFDEKQSIDPFSYFEKD